MDFLENLPCFSNETPNKQRGKLFIAYLQEISKTKTFHQALLDRRQIISQIALKCVHVYREWLIRPSASVFFDRKELNFLNNTYWAFLEVGFEERIWFMSCFEDFLQESDKNDPLLKNGKEEGIGLALYRFFSLGQKYEDSIIHQQHLYLEIFEKPKNEFLLSEKAYYLLDQGLFEEALEVIAQKTICLLSHYYSSEWSFRGLHLNAVYWLVSLGCFVLPYCEGLDLALLDKAFLKYIKKESDFFASSVVFEKKVVTFPVFTPIQIFSPLQISFLINKNIWYFFEKEAFLDILEDFEKEGLSSSMIQDIFDFEEKLDTKWDTLSQHNFNLKALADKMKLEKVIDLSEKEGGEKGKGRL